MHVVTSEIMGDLQSPSLRLPSVDGILLANVLHSFRDLHGFLRRLLFLTDNFLRESREEIPCQMNAQESRQKMSMIFEP